MEAGPASLRVVPDADTGSEEEEEENLQRRSGLRMVEVLWFRNLKEGNFKAIPSIYDSLSAAADFTGIAKTHRGSENCRSNGCFSLVAPPLLWAGGRLGRWSATLI